MGNPTNPNRVVRVKDLARFKSNADATFATKTEVNVTYASVSEATAAAAELT